MPYSVRERKLRKEISAPNYLYIIDTQGGHSGEVGEGNRKEKQNFLLLGNTLYLFLQFMFWSFSRGMIVGFTYCKKS